MPEAFERQIDAILRRDAVRFGMLFTDEAQILVAAYDEALEPNASHFGSDRAGRLASALRDSDDR
jgi:hypothetical protein